VPEQSQAIMKANFDENRAHVQFLTFNKAQLLFRDAVMERACNI